MTLKALLDTHTFIWWDGEPSRLSHRVLDLLQDPSSEILLSVVSLWEMLIKSQLGKMKFRLALSEIVNHQLNNGLKILPVTIDHVLELENLPFIHKDPFDRLLIAQARFEGAILLSSDHLLTQYPVQIFW